MSCPSEPTLLRYADAELAGAERHDLEAHLVGCRDCRARVVALQAESLWLADVMQERTRHAPHHAHAAAPEPSAAYGVPLAIALLTLATAVGGYLLESQLPGGFDLLNPLRLLGATEMAFDFVFMLRARAPGLVELAFAVAAVASVSALLSFAVGAVYRRVFGTAALLVCLLGPLPGAAFELRHVHDGDVRIGAGETLAGTLVVSSESLQMDGVIDGDLIVASERVSITGTVRGNLFAFARHVEITGTVTGAVVGLIEDADIDGSVEGSLYHASERLRLGPSGRLGRDLASFGYDVVLAGRVARDVFFAGERLDVRGEIGRNLLARRVEEQIALADAARIGGDVDAWLGDPQDLVRAAGAQVAGQIEIHEPERAHRRYLAAYREPLFWAIHAVGFVGAFLFGLLVYALAPRLLDFELRSARSLFGTLGLGFAALIATPLALLLLALTLVGIPIAALGFAAWLTSLYLAEIVVAAAIGRRLLPPADASIFAFGKALLAGLAPLAVAQHIPFVGVPIWVLAALVGFGSLAAKARDWLFARREGFAA
jgi:cytoskeletal protein CcmA (bactofilin family)